MARPRAKPWMPLLLPFTLIRISRSGSPPLPFQDILQTSAALPRTRIVIKTSPNAINQNDKLEGVWWDSIGGVPLHWHWQWQAVGSGLGSGKDARKKYPAIKPEIPISTEDWSINPRNYLMKNLKKDGHHVSCLNLHSKSCKQSLCIYVCVSAYCVFDFLQAHGSALATALHRMP